MGIRKQIYISDEETWGKIQEAAKAEGRSVSNYLVQLHVEREKFSKALNQIQKDPDFIDATELLEAGKIVRKEKVVKPQPEIPKAKEKESEAPAKRSISHLPKIAKAIEDAKKVGHIQYGVSCPRGKEGL